MQGRIISHGVKYHELLYIEDVHRNVMRREMNKDDKATKLLEELEQEKTKEKGPYRIIGKTDIDKHRKQRNRVVLPDKYMIPILINIHIN